MPVGPYLGNYKRVRNETWFIDRWQREKVHNLTFYLSYLSLLFFIKGGFLCHVLVYK